MKKWRAVFVKCFVSLAAWPPNELFEDTLSNWVAESCLGWKKWCLADTFHTEEPWFCPRPVTHSLHCPNRHSTLWYGVLSFVKSTLGTISLAYRSPREFFVGSKSLPLVIFFLNHSPHELLGGSKFNPQCNRVRYLYRDRNNKNFTSTISSVTFLLSGE